MASNTLIAGSDSMEIALTKGMVAIVDVEDYIKTNKHNWYYQKGIGKKTGYARTVINNKKILMHRFVLNLCDSNVLVDHKNGNGIDNRKENLRICSVIENSYNRSKKERKHSKYRGVHWYGSKYGKHKWVVTLWKNKKRYYGGLFIEESDAIKKAIELGCRLYGDFFTREKL